MADDSNVAKMIGVAGLALSSGASAALATGACSWCALQAYREGRLSRGWWWLRVGSLGGVTTVGQALEYECALWRRGLDQREEVRTLSCGHVYHLRKSAKCENTIDGWLRENRMRCPVCCQIAHPVLPWKSPPASAPPPTSARAVTVDDPTEDPEAAVAAASAADQGLAEVFTGGPVDKEYLAAFRDMFTAARAMRTS